MICFFMLLIYINVPFSHKDLLCFHKTLPLVPSDLLKLENIIREWSIEKEAKALCFLTDSCKTLDMKK